MVNQAMEGPEIEELDIDETIWCNSSAPCKDKRSTMMIEAKGLRKAFKDHVVLDGIDFNVDEGSIFSLLGPNGAGKTTTLQILSTLIRPDSGEVRIANHDLNREAEAVRAVIAVTGQFSAVDNVLTGEENMMLMANLRHFDRRMDAAEQQNSWNGSI
jgi:ABC-2 type transport system ATP-binding protein